MRSWPNKGAPEMSDSDDYEMGLQDGLAKMAKLREALEMFVAHYPSGINPSLDEAYRLARAALK